MIYEFTQITNVQDAEALAIILLLCNEGRAAPKIFKAEALLSFKQRITADVFAQSAEHPYIVVPMSPRYRGGPAYPYLHTCTIKLVRETRIPVLAYLYR